LPDLHSFSSVVQEFVGKGSTAIVHLTRYFILDMEYFKI
jgi:hypothetical protein